MHRLAQYVRCIKEWLMKNGNWESDQVLSQKLTKLFETQPTLQSPIVVGANLDYLQRLDAQWLRKLFLQLKIDLSAMLQLYSDQLLRWEMLAQAQRVWDYVKDFAQLQRSQISEEYTRAVETVLLPSTAYRYTGNQVLYNGCILPLSSFKVMDVQYTQTPAEFKLNVPHHNVSTVELNLYGFSQCVLVDLPGEQDTVLTVWYENEHLPWTFRQRQVNQLLFKPHKAITKLRIDQRTIRQVYQLEGAVEDTSVTFYVGTTHIQPKSAEYSIVYSANAESSVSAIVRGLKSDIGVDATTNGTIQLDLSGKDPLTVYVLYGKYDRNQQYLTGQHYKDGYFVQYAIWNGSQLPNGVEGFELHSMTQSTRPNGLCVLKFKDVQLLQQLNAVADTYAYIEPVYRFEVVQ